MADPTPLLSHSTTGSDEHEPPKLEKHHPSLDSMIERSMKDFGWAQLMQASLVSLAGFFDAQQTFLCIFTDVQPPWHCVDLDDKYCNSMSDVCLLPNSSSWQWDYPKHASIVSEWGLQCANSAIRGLPASSFFLGCLIGGLLLATLADSSLGRKNMLFLSCFVMSCSSLLTVFSTNVWIYSGLKFVTGFGRATIGTCALVLTSELVGKKLRGSVGVMGFFTFTLGFLSLPAIAYVNRGSSWRALYIWTSVPAFGYCVLVHFLVCESPRWLFVRGRREEAVATLKSISPPSSSALTKGFSSISLDEDPLNNMDIFSAIKALLEKKWAFRRLCAVMLVGFGTGMVYYGMPLGVTNLDFDLYSSVTLNALAELPSTLVTFFLIGKLDRRSSLLFFTTLSGFCSVMCILEGQVWQKWQIGLELVSFFSGCTALDVLLIYALELFPTCVRNSAIAMVRQAVVFGGVFSPLLVAAAGRRGDGVLSYGAFGLVIGCCGLFVLWLPETRGGNLCDTMDEEERKQNIRDSLC
ncbi:organic cation/carnitine transporter 3-like [Rhodamnia argentea]|uniref:Organic cation/carnitine transporter 3-like n=1 Tax=Rhodamnia argentea TaxID=178133 RepID=A0A8B8QG53_9MYRT|nr:organic cation/carnitine transporter 3-like [Rhodamnia argentea]